MDSIKLTKDYNLSLFDLQLPVESVAKDFTLYDLFSMVIKLEKNVPGISAAFGMPNLDLFWKKIQEEPTDNDSDMKYLELYWHITYDVRVADMTSEERVEYAKTHSTDDFLYSEKNYWDDLEIGELSSLMDFHGRGKYSKEDLKLWPETSKSDDACSYGVSFSPINNLKNYPIRLDNNVVMTQPFVKQGAKPSRTGFTLKIDPTLWCFITSIFWELTFCGYAPKDIENETLELRKRVDEAKEFFNES